MVSQINDRVKSTAVSVGTAATALPAIILTGRASLVLHNDGSNTVYLGGSAVTTSGATKGLPLASGAEFQLDIGKAGIIYGIVATGTESVICFEGA